MRHHDHVTLNLLVKRQSVIVIIILLVKLIDISGQNILYYIFIIVFLIIVLIAKLYIVVYIYLDISALNLLIEYTN
jgi:hypothetical protein